MSPPSVASLPIGRSSRHHLCISAAGLRLGLFRRLFQEPECHGHVVGVGLVSDNHQRRRPSRESACPGDRAQQRPSSSALRRQGQPGEVGDRWRHDSAKTSANRTSDFHSGNQPLLRAVCSCRRTSKSSSLVTASSSNRPSGCVLATALNSTCLTLPSDPHAAQGPPPGSVCQRCHTPPLKSCANSSSRPS